jgi:hypothetical protein
MWHRVAELPDPGIWREALDRIGHPEVEEENA